MADYQIYFRLNNGLWNNNPAADPVANVGGIDISAVGVPTPVDVIVQGTGDAGITANFGASPFVFPVPAGYTPGWPDILGNPSVFSPGAVQGSAVVDGSGLQVSFLSSPGIAWANTNHLGGKFYFELVNPTGDIFSADWGGGIGDVIAIVFSPGGNYVDWIGSGKAGPSNPLGGALVTGQVLGSHTSSIRALGVNLIPSAFDFAINAGNVLGIAVFLTEPAPPASQVTIADLFFANTPGFVDFTEPANRRKFIAVNGGAQNLQSDGSGPFAVSPPVFLSLQGSDPPNMFADNRGRGGVFVRGGADLVAGASDPPEVTVTTLSVATTVPFSSVLGDYLTGNIYAFNPDTLADNGSPRKWLRRWRALPGDTTSAITFSYLAIDMETGTEVPPGTNPQLVLRWSDDGGKTWGGNRIIPVGVTGQTAFTVKSNRLGSTSRFGGSTRIFELSSTDPFKVSIISAEVMTK